MKKLILIVTTVVLMTGCCVSQIPTQYYFAADSCEFYLPDYSQAVEVRDNCCVDSMGLYQQPNSGTRLTLGSDVTVTLAGRDCSGNEISMSFDVVVIDKVPPTFYYDTALFAPLGMYQNETRTWHFWTDSEPDTTLEETPLYYSQKKSARDRTTGIGTEIHDARYQSPDYFKMSTFMARSTYRVMDLYMAIAKRGDPQGKLRVEIWQLDFRDTSLIHPVCGGEIDLNNVHERFSQDPSDVQPEELIWQTVNVTDGILIRGGFYAIRTYCEGDVTPEKQVIWNTTNYVDYDPYTFLKYSYDGEESYGVNPESNYMYQIFGIDLN